MEGGGQNQRTFALDRGKEVGKSPGEGFCKVGEQAVC